MVPMVYVVEKFTVCRMLKLWHHECSANECSPFPHTNTKVSVFLCIIYRPTKHKHLADVKSLETLFEVGDLTKCDLHASWYKQAHDIACLYTCGCG